MRIDIVGLPGSGKSTLARALSRKLGMPHIQLDTFWFEAGGRQGAHDTPNIESVRAHIHNSIAEAVRQESWVSDGTYLREQGQIAPLADVIVFLDLSLWHRLIAHTRRVFFEPKRHTDLALLEDLKFYKQIITRTFRSRPKLLRFVETYREKTITLHSYKEIDAYLESAKSQKSTEDSQT